MLMVRRICLGQKIRKPRKLFGGLRSRQMCDVARNRVCNYLSCRFGTLLNHAESPLVS
ncbi:hypothetical protein [Rubellimicrobium rubrum]|uniref:hypothetical protein n=1 Tax=Rubellimicrobium rubrum TaxID=2585369 RepID=UPI001FE952CB|nr:hypothetical protein [Rubellimicrobium rubrum]